MKHIPLQRRPQQGYMLLESLISFVVVGVGILGATKLNTTILQGASASKARAEATALAQTAIENARNYALPDGCGTLTTPQSTTTTTGVNAVYTISTVYTPQTEGTRVVGQGVNVSVSWGNEQIALSSAVTCAPPGTSAMVGDGGAANQMGNALTPPSGRAVVGGTLEAAVGTPTTNRFSTDVGDASGDAGNDGTQTRVTASGRQLTKVGSDGVTRVLLHIKKLDCETTAPDFSTISGKVFIKAANNGNPSVPHSSLMVMPSDAGYCSIMPYGNASTRRLPTGATGNGIDFYYTYYKCYVGAGWYGNIGDVLTGSAANTAGVCVGNPGASVVAGNTFSAHPQLGNRREYWGYNAGRTAVVGIGFASTTSAALCPSYTPKNYEGHHFLVGSGLDNNNDCSAAETQINADTSNSLNAAPTADPSYGGNPGRKFCMFDEAGLGCSPLP